MKSKTTIQFRKLFTNLSSQVQAQARIAYHQFREDPNHPSLRLKRVHRELPIYSARINRRDRAVGQLAQDTMIWFWIGSHDEYEMLLHEL